MGITMWYLLFSRLELSTVGVLFTIGWLLFGRAVRGVSNLKRHPLDLLVLPMLALVVIAVALPIKVYSFVTMNKQGWLTRHADQVGGDGQQARTLQPETTTGRRVASPGVVLPQGAVAATSDDQAVAA